MVLPHTATRLRAELVENEYGSADTERNWSDASESDFRCFVQRVEATEIADDREASVVMVRIFLPLGVDLLTTDRVKYEGVTYEVNGDLVPWRVGNRGYNQTMLTRVTG